MVRLYKELGENGVIVTTKCNPDSQIMIFTFEKRCMSWVYTCSMELASDNDRLVDFLVKSLREFMEYYQIGSSHIKYMDSLWDRAIEKS